MAVSRQPESKTGEWGGLEQAAVPRNPDKGRAKGRDAKGKGKGGNLVCSSLGRRQIKRLGVLSKVFHQENALKRRKMNVISKIPCGC